MSTITGVLPALQNLTITVTGSIAVGVLVILVINAVQLASWLIDTFYIRPTTPNESRLYQNTIVLDSGKQINVTGPVDLTDVLSNYSSKKTRYLNYTHNKERLLVPIESIDFIQCQDITDNKTEEIVTELTNRKEETA